MSYAVASFVHGEPTATPIPSSQQKLGIEIEVENVRALELEGHTASQYWSVTGDGSLRNGGVEFVSKVLLADQFESALRSFYSLWEPKHMHASIRCGIHVHMNCLQLKIPDLAGIFTTYALLEPFLMGYCGDLREENIYCVPWYRSTPEADKAAVLVKDPKERFTVLRQTVAHACKYAALNFGPLQRFGTLEFRHAPTWETIEPTTAWVNILLRIMDYGAKRDPKEILDAWHRDPEVWYLQVLSRWCPSTLRMHVLKAEEVGAVSVAEKFLQISKTKARDWGAPALHVQGEGTIRYAETSAPQIARTGRTVPRPPRQPRTAIRISTATLDDAATIMSSTTRWMANPVANAVETSEQAAREQRAATDRMMNEIRENT